MKKEFKEMIATKIGMTIDHTFMDMLVYDKILQSIEEWDKNEKTIQENINSLINEVAIEFIDKARGNCQKLF